MAWKYKKLGELAEVSSGGTPKKSNKDFWNGDIPWYSSGELNNLHTIAPNEYITESGLLGSNAKLFPKGSLLIGMYDTAALKMSILDREGTFNQAIAGVKPNNEVDLSFILYAINSIKPELLKLRRGVRQKNLNQGMIKDILIPDIPLAEQKRIVALLDTVFADLEQTRAKTEKNLKNARELFESYLQQAFSQKDEGWEEFSLENLVSEDCSLSYGIVQPGDDFNDGLPVVRPTDLKTELIVPDGLKLIDPVKSEAYKRTVLQGGELLVCVRGSTGITSIACKSLAGANVTRGIVPVRFNPELISDRFGYYQFISPLVQCQIKDATYGAALMQINIRDFRKIKVSTPSIEVQNLLVNKLDSIKPDLIRAEEIYEQKLLALDELKKSILQKAFSGELTADAE
ncbi:restriction endonuclease subunit S [Shewanella colwelliana]|uniref:restriction endonuclease subunit S n=1 Tax=Shewanella colwelliana TaxID=23 RepID=UPI0022AE5FB1|nr:restriction endonuclease subunit S [Shewanella colwelliana]MCZ4339765.1 restriction endonuclease subunit S [Shewanella colwelliana]